MSDASYTAPSKETEASLGDYFSLLKPRVMSLVIFTAFVGMLAAPASVHPVVGFASILFIAIGAGASGALNMWWDADIDVIMKRTVKRPIPAGKVQAGEALYLGTALSGMAVMMLALSALSSAASHQLPRTARKVSDSDACGPTHARTQMHVRDVMCVYPIMRL